MLIFISKINKILSKDFKKFPIFIALFLFMSALDLIGLSIIPLYMSLLLGENLSDIKFLSLDKFSQSDLLLYFGVGLILLFLFKGIFNTIANYIVLSFSQKILLKIRVHLFSKFQRLELEEFTQKNRSEYINKIHKISEQFSLFIILGLIRIIGEGIIIFAIIIFLLVLNPLILLLTTLVMLLFVSIYYAIFGKKVIDYGIKLNMSSEKILKNSNEAIDGFKELMILKKYNFLTRRFNKASENYAEASLNYQVISIIPRYTLEIIVTTLIITSTIYSFYLYDDFSQAIKVLSIFGFAGIRLIPSVNIITQALINFRFHSNTLDLIYDEYTESISKNYNDNENINFDRFDNLEIKDTKFKFKKNKDIIFDNLNLSIQKNNVIGIVGESGSGKTTLLNMIMGFYKPFQGSIECNNIDIFENILGWQNKIAYISQDIFLLDQSLVENIVLTDDESEIDNEKLNQVLIKCKIHDINNNLLTTRANENIGDRGNRLSGGQKQRVAIARALYHNKELLIMDEPTSALDNEIENEIINYIYSLKNEITILLVTHNKNLLFNCDKIYQFNNNTLERTN